MKKYILWILVSTVALGSCGTAKNAYLFTGFNEPANEGLRLLYSYDGYHWTDLDTIFLQPRVGVQQLMRDPSIVQGPDGTYHLVWTPSWKDDHSFGYASSKDLIHWSEQRAIPIMEKEKDVRNVWAPELFYDNGTGEFIIIFASTIPSRFPIREGEQNANRMYYTVTKDFKTFSDPQVLTDPDYNSIDAVIVKRAADDYVLVIKNNIKKYSDLRVAFGKKPLGPYTGFSEPFTPHFSEGPTVVKVNGEWLIYYDQYRDKIFGAMKTKDFKTFTDITAEVSVPKGHKHGTIIKVSKKTINKLKAFANSGT